MIALWLIVALALDRVYLRLVAPYYSSAYAAGYGTIPLIQHGQTERILGFRLLVPALMYWAEKWFPALAKYRLPALYEPLRIVALALALYVASLAIGTAGALLVAVLLPATFLFDFWDFPYEILGLAAGLTGDLRWAMLGGGLHALARPYTAPLVPVTYLLVMGDWIGAALVALATVIGLVPGQVATWKASNLQASFQVWRLNIQDIRNIFVNRPFYLSEIFMSLGLSALIVWVIATGRAGAAWPVPLALLVMHWTLVRAAETRPIAVCLLWVVGGLLK